MKKWELCAIVAERSDATYEVTTSFTEKCQIAVSTKVSTLSSPVKLLVVTASFTERCLSGRKGHPAKVLGGQLPRGFESLPLRIKQKIRMR